MDEDASDLVRAAAEGGVTALLRTLLGPLGELSDWGVDLVRRRRVATQVKTLQRTEEMIASSGLQARVVPAKVLVPLLELAGLEDGDDEEMRDRWAALLANAATSEPGTILPAFPEILGQLSGPEAAMLDWLADQPAGSNLDTFMSQAGFDPTAGAPIEPADPRYPASPYDVYVENLERLNLTQADSLQPQINASAADRWPSGSVRVTALGAAFVRACRPPG